MRSALAHGLCAALATSCAQPSPIEPPEMAPAYTPTPEGHLRVRADLWPRLRFAAAETSDVGAEIEGIGRLEFAPDAAYAVRVPFPAYVEAVHVTAGARVRPGDALASLRSGEVARLRSEVRRLGATIGAQRDAVGRYKRLVAEGAASPRELVEAEAALAGAEAELRGVREGLRAAQAGLVRALELQVERAMLDLAAALREVEIRRAAQADLEESRRIVEARVRAGIAPQYDATRMALAAAEAEAAVRSVEASVTGARGELDVAVGPLAGRLRGAPRIELFAPPQLPPVDALRGRMLERRPDLAAARARSEAARAGVTLARREVFPGIGLRVAAGFGQGPGQVDVGAGLSVPLPLLSRGQGFIDRARAETRAADSVARGLAVAAEQRLRAAYEAAQQRREVSQRYVEMSADAADALRRQAEVGYQNGRLSVLELADASFSVRDMRLRDLELALAARAAELELRGVVEVGRE